MRGRIVIWLPPYEANSYGIRVLYLLLDTLAELGISVGAYPATDDRERYRGANDRSVFFVSSVGADDWVVYPELIVGNPLKAQHVIRYLLNRPGYISGKLIEYGKSDYVIAYSLHVDPELPQLFLLTDDRDDLYRGDVKKSKVCLYEGKVGDVALSPEVQDILNQHDEVVRITKFFPATKRELYEHLRESQWLVTLDPFTNLSFEATLCGTPVLVLNDTYQQASLPFNIPLGGRAYSVQEMEQARRSLGKVDQAYRATLARTKDSVRAFVEGARLHFERVERLTRSEDGREILRQLCVVRIELDAARLSQHQISRVRGGGEVLPPKVPTRYRLIDMIYLPVVRLLSRALRRS